MKIVFLLAVFVVAAMAMVGCGKRDVPTTLINDLSALCNGNYVSTARPVGPPPRTVAVFTQAPGNSDTPYYNPGIFTEAGPAWREFGNPSEKQLVACAARDGDDTATGKTCRFSYGKSAELHAARYTVTVYVAQTGAEFGKVDIVPDNEDCPGAAVTKAGNSMVYTRPSEQQLYVALKPIVNQ